MKIFLFTFCLALISCSNLRFLQDTSGAASTASSFKNFDKLSEGVSQVCGMWNNIVGAFKNTHYTTVKKLVKQEGFDRLFLDATYKAAGGLKIGSWESIWERKFKLLQLNTDEIALAQDTLDYALYSDSANWISNNIGFDSESGSRDNIRFLTILTNVREEDNKFDYALFDFKLSFKLAPDLRWVTKGGSYGGGMYSYAKDEIIKVPKTLTENEITAIIEYFKLVSMRSVARICGIELSWPLN